MDIGLEKKVNEAIGYLKQKLADSVNFQLMDPVAKMMLVALIDECQKIQDYVDGIEGKIVERFCEDFIPRKEIEAIPAIVIVEPKFKPKKDAEMITVGGGTSFVYKMGEGKRLLNFMPLFKNSFLPYTDIYTLTSGKLHHLGESYDVSRDSVNSLWVGIETKAEVDTLKGVSFLIKGTDGIQPLHICVGAHGYELGFSDISRLEDMEMVEPFDAQQSSGKFFSLIENWKESLQHMDDAIFLSVTDAVKDRDLFKPRAYPRVFQHWLESEMLDCFKGDIIWLQFVFPEGYRVADTCTVTCNAFPLVNIDVNTVTLTQANPIAKLQKSDNSYFLQVLETSTASNKQGFDMSSEEIIIRDFDAACYHNGNLYREVRNLYNHFIDDYYAFVEYNGIKDGETIKLLRETINKIGKSVGTQNAKYQFDSGVYVMKNMNQYPFSSTTKVSYLTTQGKVGNTPRQGETMENKKLPLMEKNVPVLVSAMGGTDKATADERYELLRYYSLTNDRLYTKKDIEAFLRKELITELGKEEFKRIFIKMRIEGAAGERKLQRGLYIDIEFKDKKNYEHAASVSFDKRMWQKIQNKSCIAMPIILKLINLEKN